MKGTHDIQCGCSKLQLHHDLEELLGGWLHKIFFCILNQTVWNTIKKNELIH